MAEGTVGDPRLDFAARASVVRAACISAPARQNDGREHGRRVKSLQGCGIAVLFWLVAL